MSAVHSVLFFEFDDPDAALPALQEAKKLPGVHQAAALTRSAAGDFDIAESWVHRVGAATVAGGTVGALIGLLAGPMGSFVGATAGAWLGGTSEAHQAQDSFATLILFGAEVEDDTSQLIVDISEADQGPADELAARHGAALHRRPAEEVEARVKAAEQAADRANAEDEAAKRY